MVSRGRGVRVTDGSGNDVTNVVLNIELAPSIHVGEDGCWYIFPGVETVPTPIAWLWPLTYENGKSAHARRR